MVRTENKYTNNVKCTLQNVIYKHVIFDFDSSIFRLEKEWHHIMASYFIEVLLNTPIGSTLADPSVLSDDVTDLINPQLENNVIYYCSWLNEAVVNYGGLAQNPNVYKQEYLRRLRICIQNSYKNISNNTAEIEKMLIPGIKEYFHSLLGDGVKLYCVSNRKTTELRYVISLLELSDFFGENIFGVEYKHDFINTKELVIDKIIRENSMEPNEFIMFSNNTDDINICKKYGGISVSIISDKEKQNTKRECFELTGVDMFINDYEAIATQSNNY